MWVPTCHGAKPPLTAKTPASVPPPTKLPEPLKPPRSSAPGPSPVFAPARHMASSLYRPHPGQAVLRGTQSATHSQRLPTMSKAPTSETQLLREPVGTTASTPSPPPFFVLQSADPATDSPGSGVPRAAACHSWLVGS